MEEYFLNNEKVYVISTFDNQIYLMNNNKKTFSMTINDFYKIARKIENKEKKIKEVNGTKPIITGNVEITHKEEIKEIPKEEVIVNKVSQKDLALEQETPKIIINEKSKDNTNDIYKDYL